MKNNKTTKSSTAGFMKCCTDLAAAKDGVVAIILALSLIPLLISVGLAIDVGRAYLVKQRLIKTTDAAGLAIGASIDTTTTTADMQTVLDNYFAANWPSGTIGTVTVEEPVYDGTTITVTARAVVETTFMQIANINSLTVNATSIITRQEDSLEVVLVLDNSGSMSGTRLSSLKTASTDLVDILFGNETTSTQVKIGLVPFSNNINIGSSYTVYVTDPTAFDWNGDDWHGCVEAVTTNDEDTKDDYTGLWTPFNWSSQSDRNRYCPDAAITPLTNVKATLTTAINAMVAYGGTHINWGAIWGWRIISPSEPFTEGAAYGTADSSKAVIILTDGANTAYSWVYDAFGYPSDERLGSGIDTATEVAAEIDIRLSTICENIKNVGIIVYTITFQLTDSDTQDLFRACATDSTKYYDSPSNDELVRTFRAIAAELKKLRVSS